MTKYLHFNHFKNMSKTNKKWFLNNYNQEKTASVDLPTYQEILDIVLNYLKNGAKTFELNIGVTMVSLKDRYVKSIGRAEADKRKKSALLEIERIQLNEEAVRIYTKPHNEVILELIANKVKKTRNVYGFLEAEYNKDDFWS